MPFQYVLAEMVADSEEALGALFVDDTGEAIETVCADFNPTDMKVVGAYLGIYLNQLQQITESARLGQQRFLHVENEGLHFFAQTLVDGYYVALVQRTPAVVTRSRRRLEAAAEKLLHELFPEGDAERSGEARSEEEPEPVPSAASAVSG